MFCKVCKYRKDLCLCTVSIVIICTVNIVGWSSLIAATTVSIVNMCTVSIVCILAAGSLGIGNGVIVTLCTSCM